MSTLLRIDASPRGNTSISRQLTSAAVTAWKARHPDGKVIERDLTKTDLTFVDLDWILGSFTAAEQQTEIHRNALALSDALVAELLEADEIVIGTPMYNFAVPAIVKAWIDHVVRSGKTFAYTASGASGLAGERKVVVAVASAGTYTEDSSMAAYNYEIPYLRHILGFIGITDVTFVHAGGTAGLAQSGSSAEAFLAPFVEQVQAAIQ